MSSVFSSLQRLTENKLLVTCCNKSRIRNFLTSQTLLHVCFECDEFFCFGFPLLFLHWMLDTLGTHHLKGRMQCTKTLKPLSTHPQTYGKLGKPYSKTAFQLSLKQMKKLVLNCKQTNKKHKIVPIWHNPRSHIDITRCYLHPFSIMVSEITWFGEIIPYLSYTCVFQN